MWSDARGIRGAQVSKQKTYDRGTVEQRMLARIEKTETCWLWTVPHWDSGYVRIRANGRTQMAHRVAYELWVGPIPEGRTIDHLCRVRWCMNPAHMEPVTQGENVLRGDTLAARNAAKTHCKHGHEFSERNTYQYKGNRICRRCNSLRVGAWLKARRA